MEYVTKLVSSQYIQYIMLALRVVTPLIALLIVWRCYTSFKKGLRRYDPVLMLTDVVTGKKFPILYWENSIGRARTCDIFIPDQSISRDHCVLLRRDEGWFVCDTGSKAGTLVNGEKVEGRKLVALGDVIKVGRTELELEKSDIPAKQRRKMFTGFMKTAASPTSLLFMVTLVQISLTVQLMFGTGEITFAPLTSFVALFLLTWLFYFFSTRILHRSTFELETVGLLLSSIGIMLLTGEDADGVLTQIIAMVVGVVLFSVLLIFLEDSDRVTKYRLWLAGGALLLFAINLVLGTEINGSRNWIFIGPISLQPSEIIKIIFIVVGASTLDHLQTKKNITEFIVFGGACLGCLFIMRDFGTACIFFAGFLIIAFMRSGSIRTIALILAVAVLGVVMIISFKPYVAQRFAGWLHVWDHINDSLGYQQTRALTYIASGGFFGMGLGRGYLHFVAAGDSDLVFAMLTEEQGLLMSFTVLFAIALLIMYTRGDVSRSRSTLYSICSSAAAGILVFQMCLNVFGTTDVLPMTGVTLPFISSGGSSMMSVWGMLALIKASDERTYGAKRANHREKKQIKAEIREEKRARVMAKRNGDTYYENDSESYIDNTNSGYGRYNSCDDTPHINEEAFMQGVRGRNPYEGFDNFEDEESFTHEFDADENRSYYDPNDYKKREENRQDPGRHYAQDDDEDVYSESDDTDYDSGRNGRRYR